MNQKKSMPKESMSFRADPKVAKFLRSMARNGYTESELINHFLKVYLHNALNKKSIPLSLPVKRKPKDKRATHKVEKRTSKTSTPVLRIVK